jgi:ribosomal protein S18 acetylase RimI-like enzyme
MDSLDITIVRVTRDNYHLYEDMVGWRLKGAELTPEEKEINRHQDFSVQYKELEHPGFNSYAARYGERFIGWISMMYTPKLGSRRWQKGVLYVDELWTAPEFRGRGVATRLFQKAYDCRKETGAVEIRLYVAADNPTAQGLYKKCGLQTVSNTIYKVSK